MMVVRLADNEARKKGSVSAGDAPDRAGGARGLGRAAARGEDLDRGCRLQFVVVKTREGEAGCKGISVARKSREAVGGWWWWGWIWEDPDEDAGGSGGGG